ncbi:MAG: triose-phosphate isomerase [Verrucomicrobiota bacterium]|nr:MAG: triose-phosphate isomerase [Verrucomicrobiota bacterium]
MTKLIVGNWKMNKTSTEAAQLVQELLKIPSGVSVAICPPFTALDRCAQLLKGTPIALGAQNVYCQEKGAFTGEIAPNMLTDLGVQYVIIGHSERRSLFFETDELVNQKVKLAQQHQLIPIICVGESLEEREQNQTLVVIERQVTAALKDVTNSNLVIAYEPIWAIGTGKTATPEIAQEVHHVIRQLLSKHFNDNTIHILYGGSMKPNNAATLLAQPDITGGLIGGASLVADDFLEIIRQAA